jgi:hypothetical protein
MKLSFKIIIIATLMIMHLSNCLKKTYPLIDVWRSVEYLEGDSPSLMVVSSNNYTKSEWIQ